MDFETLYLEDDEGNRYCARLCWGAARPESRLYKIDDGPLVMMRPDGTLYDDQWQQYRAVSELYP